MECAIDETCLPTTVVTRQRLDGILYNEWEPAACRRRHCNDVHRRRDNWTIKHLYISLLLMLLNGANRLQRSLHERLTRRARVCCSITVKPKLMILSLLPPGGIVITPVCLFVCLFARCDFAKTTSQIFTRSVLMFSIDPHYFLSYI